MVFTDVIEYFHSFQGEAPYVGEQSIFVRFRYCNLMKVCPFCDTLNKMNSDVNLAIPMKSVIQQIEQTSCKCLTFTGGEPLLPQYLKQIKEFIDNHYSKHIVKHSCKILIETNGHPIKTNIDDISSIKPFIKLIWSPKFLKEDDLQLNKSIYDVLKQHHFDFYIKPVVYAQILEVLDDFLTYVSEYRHRIYLMPKGASDEELKANSKQAIDLAFTHKLQISPRMHLTYNLP